MELFKLDNQIKHYAWGSPDWIPALTGRQNPEKTPWAELWMGVHGGGPSKVAGKNTPLGEFIAADPGRLLGGKAANLPFLLKILAAASPLSIQAHPNSEDARRGWDAENAAGIKEESPDRNYRDPNHKPEIICALTPFTVMAGFREPSATERLAGAFFPPGAPGDRLKRALDGGCKNFLSALFALDEKERRTVTALAAGAARPAAQSLCAEAAEAFALCKKLAAAYPGDPGILAPLYLNVMELQPFQAIYLPSGILHSYVHGLGVECMANSDNVLRGGLTAKHIDKEELFRILRFRPYTPEINSGEPDADENWHRYSTPFREFALFRLTLHHSAARLTERGAAIAVVTRGNVSLSAGTGAALRLAQGESAFIPFRGTGQPLSAEGDADLFAALIPET
ncbi:MAG: mannose-6-phosphate isomerase, class I [Treponema sp.]|jgi:mannose-6-phosphate isomerase|nr:mannose-6-phosphate isomerase, class I [Treponema sp.]